MAKKISLNEEMLRSLIMECAKKVISELNIRNIEKQSPEVFGGKLAIAKNNALKRGDMDSVGEYSQMADKVFQGAVDGKYPMSDVSSFIDTYGKYSNPIGPNYSKCSDGGVCDSEAGDISGINKEASIEIRNSRHPGFYKKHDKRMNR